MEDSPESKGYPSLSIGIRKQTMDDGDHQYDNRVFGRCRGSLCNLQVGRRKDVGFGGLVRAVGRVPA